MNKKEILKKLNEIQFDLGNTKSKLQIILDLKVWDNSVSNELDDTISLFQEINNHINNLVEIQKKIINK